jgi:hypothetical protein
MGAKRFYLVGLGAAVAAVIVVAAITVGSHLFRPSQSKIDQSGRQAESTNRNEDVSAGKNVAPDGQQDGARSETNGSGNNSLNPVRTVADVDEASAEVKTALPGFHRTDESYARGAVPASGGVELLKQIGVKTIIDLRSYYDHADDIGPQAEGLGIRYYWLPLSVWDPATDEQTAEFLSLVGDASKGPFFVFCTDGQNRTGEMTAIYRIIHDGWSAENAVKEMDDLGFGAYYYSLRSYVWHYARHHGPAAKPSTRRFSLKAER